MKIVQINAVFGIASTGRTTMELHKALIASGHSSFVVYGQQQNTSLDGYYMGSDLDHKFHALFARITGLVGYFSFFHTEKLLKYLDEVKPDIVHIRNLHSNYINIPLLLKYLSKKNIATVVSLHDCFFYTGKCTHYTITNCYRWQEHCGNCPRKKMDNKSWLFDRSEKMLDDKIKYFSGINNLAVVGVSKWTAHEARRSRVFQNSKIITSIYNWVDIDLFKPTDSDIKDKMNLQGKVIVLGVASSWANSKGLDDFIRLADMLDEKFAVVLIGDMPAKELPSNIINIPATKSVDDLVKYYSCADVFVNLSVEETFGKVTAEALSCGTPAIVYNTTACPELIGEGCGEAVELFDVDKVFEAVKNIADKGKDKYSSSCREFAIKNFNKDDCIKSTIDLYGDLLSKK